MKCTAVKMGINGEGIGYLDRKPVFIDQLLPSETALIEITEQTPRYSRARVVRRQSVIFCGQFNTCPSVPLPTPAFALV